MSVQIETTIEQVEEVPIATGEEIQTPTEDDEQNIEDSPTVEGGAEIEESIDL